MKTIVVAYDQLRTIGREGALPWQGKLPVDLAHFKQVTGGNNECVDTSIIMGRKTAESLPNKKPLKNRENILISRMSDYALEGFLVAPDLETAYEMASYEPYVVGGGEIYKQALHTVDRVLATEIYIPNIDEHEPGDAFFPCLPESEWKKEHPVEGHLPDEDNRYWYAFVTYMRRHPILMNDRLDPEVYS